ncbi:FAD-dependent oxidoreductase [Pontibacter sp. G13]|uniref:flavin monoamine oxidase family protein n=1 Tax=Pontibacter sp. G13 TaxID=3074898 RepID=UPI00288B3F5F|nr:FAD-dependent oxidoreductase [Pontibacter sp. G13]WNJ19641.1 FAD-dependent oxidoreductase [Pontibacter sp. G13]
MDRKTFIQKAALLSGSAYGAMMGLGMLPKAPATPIRATAVSQGPNVLILGGGLAGLSAAYELKKLGYQPTILEARNRPGGRCYSIRQGDILQETELPEETCQFDPGQYFNAGPARIPHHHEISLEYCRELGLELEVFVNHNEAGFFYSQGKGPLANKPLRMREVKADMRGYTSELLVKAIDQKSLRLPMSPNDVDQLRTYLIEEGGLNPDLTYTGSERRGYDKIPGVNAGTVADAHELRSLLFSGFAHPAMSNVGEYTYHQQPVMLQVRGGMDKIAYALAERVYSDLKLGVKVQEITQTDKQVQVSYLDRKGKVKKISAPYCICTLPLTVLRNLKHPFEGKTKEAVHNIPYMITSKVAMQFNERFWERQLGIYGGISKTNMDINQIFYPSYDFLGKKGVLVGAYNFHNRAKRVGNLDRQGRLSLALQQGERIHPQYTGHYENGISIAWHKVPYTMGGWAEWTPDLRSKYHEVFQKPDGRILFAGEHTTHLHAWMAGAFTSARQSVQQIHDMEQSR